MKPPILQIAVGVALFALIQLVAYLFDWRGQLDEIDEHRAGIERRMEDYLNKKRVAVNLPLYREQLGLADASFGARVRELPDRIDPQLLKLLATTAAGAGLSVEDMRSADQETMREFYVAVPVSLRASGRYHDLGTFAADVASLPQFVTLEDLSIGPAARDGRLPISARATFYRYLSDEEIIAQRKAAQAARKGKKG